MPLFLERAQLYRLIQQELPEKVYRDDEPGNSYTTADVDSVAVVLETCYSNLERIYDNYFPQTADEKIADWEIKVFGELGSALDSLETRRGKILAKIRSQKGITKADIAELVQTVIGVDKVIEIIEYTNGIGNWILGESELGVDTRISGMYLVGANRLVSGPDIWEKTAADFGITEDELADLKQEAYGYTIKIINYEATAEELSKIEQELSKFEPARSWHVIENNASLEEAAFDWLIDFSELEENTYL